MQPAASALPPLTLTTSEFLARALRRDHALSQKRAGLVAWAVPPIHSLQHWCREQWLQTWPSTQLLHAVQELALWQRTIDEDGSAASVLSRSALAREARAMGRLVIRHCIDVDQIACYTDEHHAFARWHRVVRRTLADQGWVLDCELPGLVAQLIQTGEIPLPRTLTLAGAAQLTPLEDRLLQVLTLAGCKVNRSPSIAQPINIDAHAYSSDELQFRALALALRACLPASDDTSESLPTLLVVCPDPQARRQSIEAAFRPVLAPWLLLPGEGQRPIPWRFSHGRGLDQQPLVAVALAICGLSEQANTLDELTRVLLASILWTPAQRELLAQADYALRDLGGTQFPLKLLAKHVPEPLGMRFQTLLEHIHIEPRRALPSQWVEHFTQRLNQLGWPGDRSLPSAVFQTREHWTQALATFSAMDTQVGPLAQGAALGWLREIVSSKPFEPRADHDQPILILTPDEAAGLSADHLFIVDATDDALPGLPRRYPLLANEALISARVPDVNATTTLAATRTLVEQLAAQAPTLHLSYSEIDGRGAQRQPSPLFGPDLIWKHDIPQVLSNTVERAAAAQIQLIWPDNDPVPPVRDPAAEGIFGGTSIFKDYVEAPFFAFCKYRLGIRPLPEASSGIPPRAQGKIAHAVLEQVWRTMRTQQTLLELSEQSLGKLIDAPLGDALDKHLPKGRFGPVLRQMEHARLRDIVLQWLEHEKRRTEHFEVINCEQHVDLNFCGLALHLIIDRVDRVQTRLGDERYLIIDYKTGRAAETRGWSSDQLSEPQLPLYATTASLGELDLARVDGIAFAHLKDGHPALVPAINWGLGLIEEKARFRMDSWPEQLDRWQAALSEIANGFLAGNAGIGQPQRYRHSFNRGLLELVREQP